MDKEILIRDLRYISDTYFDKKDYISAGQINRAIDVIEDYYATIEITINNMKGDSIQP